MNYQKSEVIFVHQNLICNWLTSLVHAKSTGELISFGFSDRSVRSLVSAKRLANRWDQTKKRLHFLADLWSQSEFRTRRQTDPKSEMTHCTMYSKAQNHNWQLQLNQTGLSACSCLTGQWQQERSQLLLQNNVEIKNSTWNDHRQPWCMLRDDDATDAQQLQWRRDPA